RRARAAGGARGGVGARARERPARGGLGRAVARAGACAFRPARLAAGGIGRARRGGADHCPRAAGGAGTDSRRPAGGARILYRSADPGVPVRGHKGASVHIRELARALVEAGADVQLASPRVEFEGDELPRGVTAHTISGILPKTHATTGTLHAALDAQT